MKSGRIKIPDGRLLKYRPDPVELLLRRLGPAQPSASTDRRTVGGPSDSLEQASSSYATLAFDARKLAGAEVIIFGAGAIGSWLSYFLGPAQLVQNAIDCKKVQSKHTCGGRTVYDPPQVGMTKVDALKQKLERNCVGTTVNPHFCNVAQMSEAELMLMFSRSTLVALAMDDPQQIVRISDIAYPIVDLIQIAMHKDALSGHIALTMPFVTPCLRCTLDITGPGQMRRLDGAPGSSWHITRVAHEAAMVAIDIIYSKVTGQTIARWDTANNLIYIANTKQDVSPDGPGLRFEGSRKRPGCPVCDNLAGCLKGLDHAR